MGGICLWPVTSALSGVSRHVYIAPRKSYPTHTNLKVRSGGGGGTTVFKPLPESPAGREDYTFTMREECCHANFDFGIYSNRSTFTQNHVQSRLLLALGTPWKSPSVPHCPHSLLPLQTVYTNFQPHWISLLCISNVCAFSAFQWPTIHSLQQLIRGQRGSHPRLSPLVHQLLAFLVINSLYLNRLKLKLQNISSIDLHASLITR